MGGKTVAVAAAVVVALLLTGAMFGEDGALPEGEVGIASRYPGDVGIGNDPDVIYATGFEDGITGGLRANRSGVVVLSDPNVARTGDVSVQVTATRGKDTGGDLIYTWEPGVDQAFVRVYVKFDRDTVTPHHFVGMGGRGPNYKWGGGAGYRPAGDSNFGTTIEPPNLDEPNSGWHFYTYWHEMHSWQTPQGAPDGRPNAFYGNNFRPDDQRPFVGRDRWISVEWMVKTNTIGEHDGEMAFWIDGKKVGHWGPGFPVGTWIRDRFVTSGFWNKAPKPFQGFSWRTDERLKVNRLWLQWYVSDRVAAAARTDTNIVYFDDLVVARKYIGPLRTEK